MPKSTEKKKEYNYVTTIRSGTCPAIAANIFRRSTPLGDGQAPLDASAAKRRTERRLTADAERLPYKGSTLSLRPGGKSGVYRADLPRTPHRRTLAFWRCVRGEPYHGDLFVILP